MKIEPVFFIFFHPQGQQINEAACDLAREVANEGDALVAGGISQTPAYLSCKNEAEVKAIFKKQADVFVQKNVDFLIAEVLMICFFHLIVKLMSHEIKYLKMTLKVSFP